MLETIFDTTSSMRREGVVGLHAFLNPVQSADLFGIPSVGIAASSMARTRGWVALQPQVTVVRHDTGELFDLAADALAGGADRADVRRIAAEMLRLGLMDGERLRRMADEASDGA